MTPGIEKRPTSITVGPLTFPGFAIYRDGVHLGDYYYLHQHQAYRFRSTRGHEGEVKYARQAIATLVECIP